MRSNARRLLSALPAVAASLALAAATAQGQQSATGTKEPAGAQAQGPAPAAGAYTVTGSVEVGYRGLSVDGDVNRYRSDLNYKAGPRIFDSSFYAKSNGGGAAAFDSLMVTSTGWGADPQGQMRVSAEKSGWYRFDGSYRRFKYFRSLNNIVNPNYGSVRPPDPAAGLHNYDTRQQVGDFDLTVLPNNRRVRFNVGFSPTRYSGPVFTTWRGGGDEFLVLERSDWRSNDFRAGADWRLGPVDFSFQQGLRRFRDEATVLGDGVNLGMNPAASNAYLTGIERAQPVRGRVDYSRLSAHTLVAKRLDLTGRLVYSSATTDFDYVESVRGVNFNTRITNIPGAINPPNILALGRWDFAGGAKRPSTLGDFGVTYAATRRLRVSNTFRFETFQISGGAFYNGVFNLTRANGTGAVSLLPSGSASELTKYRKVQNTVEADYEFDNRYSARFGYRVGRRRLERFFAGANLASNGAPPLGESSSEESVRADAFIGGVKARPVKGLTLSLDAERGTADNVFVSRAGDYDYWNLRARGRYAAGRRVKLNLAFVARNNSNPSEVERDGAAVSLADFGVDTRSRVFSSSVDWTAARRLSVAAGYNYRWVEGDAAINYAFGAGVPNGGIRGRSLYFVRNQYFNFDVVAQATRRVSVYASYRISRDAGQGGRRSDPANGLLISSYPMSYQSPEARVSVRLNRRLDWSAGYQYYNYDESRLADYLGNFAAGPRPQNYRAHLPYTSLRLYFGRGDDR